ncbi:hypothetical protein ACFL3Q_14295 [Planctomycetota bacterium]
MKAKSFKVVERYICKKMGKNKGTTVVILAILLLLGSIGGQRLVQHLEKTRIQKMYTEARHLMGHVRKIREGMGRAEATMKAFDTSHTVQFGTDWSTWPTWAHADISGEQAFIDKGTTKVNLLASRYGQILAKYDFTDPSILPAHNFGTLPESIW